MLGFQRNQYGVALAGPAVRAGQSGAKFLHERLAFVSVSPPIMAWPAPSPGAPDFGGIAEAFNNPLQTIRDEFGTMRLGRVFSQKNSLAAIYTIDDNLRDF